jgi:hypothetical protein
MLNTNTTLTQQKQNANFFELKNSQIARSGLLEKIHFEQWHVFRELRSFTRNVNVINLASMLAVFPRMGIFAYEISQAEMAEKMSALFSIPVPARNTVSKWENELKRLGFLEIPKHVNWRQQKTKIRVITKKFWELSRRGLPSLSYTCPHVTYLTGKVDRVVQDTPKAPLVSNSVTEIRAHETIKKQSGQSRAVSRLNKTAKKFSRPPKNQNVAPKKLNKFENSVGHWLFQNNRLDSYREAVILFSRFLQIASGDEYCAQLRRAWADCRDASRPGLVSQLIDYLRALNDSMQIPSEKNTVCESSHAQQQCSLSEPRDDDPDRESLRLALFFGTPYPHDGKYSHVVRHFQNSDRDEQETIIELFCSGNL